VLPLAGAVVAGQLVRPGVRQPELAPALDQHPDQLAHGPGFVQPHRDPGVTAVERGQHGRQRVEAEPVVGGDVEPAGGQLDHVADRRLGRGQVPQHPPGRLDQRPPGRGRGQPAAVADEQLRAEVAFEGPDRLRQRRLRHVQLVGGHGDPTVLDHGEEVLQPAQVHGQSPRADPCSSLLG
jgi:hypothetical protein